VEKERLHNKIDDTVPGWVYVIYYGIKGGKIWHVGTTRDLDRRLKEHAVSRAKEYTQGTEYRTLGIMLHENYIRNQLYGLIYCKQASTAYAVEQIIHAYPYNWDHKVLKWLVESFGGKWNERGVKW